MIQQITIIGTGLIGGSFGLAVRKHGFRGRIVGCDRDPVLHEALRRGAIDQAVPDPAEACRGSQLVLLATPVGAIMDLIERIGPALPPDAILTDTGSTKADVLARARQVFGAIVHDRFVAGHPMAGKEHGGVEHADADLFQGAPWILVPTPGQNLLAGTFNAYFVLLETIGARIMTMGAEAHDHLYAWISHLPQMISIALANILIDEFGTATGNDPGLADVHANKGRQLREMTRTSASSYSMWRDVAFTNTANLDYALQRLEQRLAHIRENLRSPELRREFEKANSFEEKNPPPRHRDTEKT
jgi:prephenate dehydrogenase